MAINRPSGSPAPTRQGPAPAGQKPPSGGLAPMRSGRFWLTFLILLLLNIFITNVVLAPAPPKSVVIPYNVSKQPRHADNLISVTSTGDAIAGVTRNAVSAGSGQDSATHFSTQRPAFASQDLEPLLEQHHVTINAQPPNPPTPLWLTLLLSFGPTALIIGGFLYLSRRMAGAGAGGL